MAAGFIDVEADAEACKEEGMVGTEILNWSSKGGNVQMPGDAYQPCESTFNFP